MRPFCSEAYLSVLDEILVRIANPSMIMTTQRNHDQNARTTLRVCMMTQDYNDILLTQSANHPGSSALAMPQFLKSV